MVSGDSEWRSSARASAARGDVQANMSEDIRMSRPRAMRGVLVSVPDKSATVPLAARDRVQARWKGDQKAGYFGGVVVTLAQSGIRAGATLKLKLAGLLGGMQGSCAVGASEVRAPAESAAPENEVAQRHAKLCMDVSGLIRKGKFGGIALFDSTLEEQVGCMDAPALRGMYAEHVMHAASSAAPFSPPNNPSLTCTPEGSLPQGARLYVCARRRGITSEQL